MNSGECHTNRKLTYRTSLSWRLHHQDSNNVVSREIPAFHSPLQGCLSGLAGIYKNYIAVLSKHINELTHLYAWYELLSSSARSTAKIRLMGGRFFWGCFHPLMNSMKTNPNHSTASNEGNVAYEPRLYSFISSGLFGLIKRRVVCGRGGAEGLESRRVMVGAMSDRLDEMSECCS